MLCILQKPTLPLHWASEMGQIDMVKFHLENTYVDCKDTVGLEMSIQDCEI